MNKELALDILYNYILEKKDLPKWDEKVTTVADEHGISTWTFRGLLKYAYEFKDKYDETI
jgi:hypothetical protein